jgi:hypothetical protein
MLVYYLDIHKIINLLKKFISLKLSFGKISKLFFVWVNYLFSFNDDFNDDFNEWN